MTVCRRRVLIDSSAPIATNAHDLTSTVKTPPRDAAARGRKPHRQAGRHEPYPSISPTQKVWVRDALVSAVRVALLMITVH